MANALTDPPFAADPPVKLNVNAKILGLVIGIIAIIGAILSLIGLLAAFGACTILGQTIGGCGVPILWLLGAVIQVVAYILGAVGGFRMYQLNREGKNNVVYGLALGFLGTIVYLIGNIIFYAGISVIGAGYGGAIVGVIIDLIIIFIFYYLVVISRFPGEAPLVPSA
ncbi:MAG: hypothetical protein JOZ75_02520 [Candidatus Dormibacteraeota bacterium]|nr:hypothetical protein [Candidatus Dormibacteraeota bacterium]